MMYPADLAGAFAQCHIERKRDHLRYQQRAINETDFTAAQQIIFDEVRHDSTDRINGDEGEEVHRQCVNEGAIFERFEKASFQSNSAGGRWNSGRSFTAQRWQ
jgi:hypothetical protein